MIFITVSMNQTQILIILYLPCQAYGSFDTHPSDAVIESQYRSMVCGLYIIQYHLDVLETNIWKGVVIDGLLLSLTLVTML